MILPGMGGMVLGRGVRPVAIELVDTRVSAVNSAAYNFAGVGYGAARADRYIMVVVASGGGSTIALSSLSLGPLAGPSEVPILGAQSASGSRVAIAMGHIPSGTSGVVNTVWASSVSRQAFAVYRITGLESATPVDTDGATDTSAPIALSASLDVMRGGLVVAGSHCNNSLPNWTGVVENYGLPGPSWEDNEAFSAAAQVMAASSAAYGVGATWPDGWVNGTLFAVSLR